MWTAIIQFFVGKGFTTLVEGYKAKLAAGNTSERIAADLAGRELAVQQRETEVEGEYKRALIGHWYEPVNLLAYIIVFYVFVVVVWDTILGLGVTPSVKGQVGDWMGAVVLFLVGKRGFENIARIIRR